MSACPPSMALERYLLGEIAGTTSAEWVPHIEACPKCQEALAEMKRIGDTYAATAKLAPLASPASRSPLLRAAGVLALAASIAIAVLLLRPQPNDFTPKGHGVLSLQVDASAWTTGGSIPRGARVQMLWTSSDASWVAVLGREASGDTSVLFPDGGSEAVRVPAGASQPIGASFVADASLEGAELIVFSAPERFELAPLTPSATGFSGHVDRLKIAVEDVREK